MPQVTIHEFSTGINAEIFPDGSWLSRGFKAEYMNATLSPIPQGVRRAIANELFAVVEGKETEEPAVIGREVYDPQQSQWWSVVALVNKGQDEKGRPISVTRYFLTQGKGNLWQILAWMEQIQQQTGKLPIFNPSDSKSVGQPMTLNVDYPETKSLPDNLRNSQVVLLKDEYTLQDINRCVQERTQGNAPVTWAVNIEALENPGNFTLIQAANIEAFKRIKSKIGSIQAIVPETFDEQKIKNAIKTLMNRDTVSENAVRILANAFEEEKSEQIWHKLFNGEGADKAIRQNIHSPQLARLLSLRIFAPFNSETKYQNNVELIKWLKLKPNFKKYPNITINGFVNNNSNSENTIEEIFYLYLDKLNRQEIEIDDVIEFLNLLKPENSIENEWQKKLIDKFTNKLDEVANIENEQDWDDFKENNKEYPYVIRMFEPIAYDCINRARNNRGNGGSRNTTNNNNLLQLLIKKIESQVNILFKKLNQFTGTIPEDELDKAIEAIDTTNESLNTLVNEIYKASHLVNSESLPSERDIQNKIVDTFMSVKSINFLPFIYNKNNDRNQFYEFIFDSRRREEFAKKKQLIQMIYSYQKDNEINANGIIENRQDETFKCLLEDIIKQLRDNQEYKIFPDELEKARQDFDTTKKFLNVLSERTPFNLISQCLINHANTLNLEADIIIHEEEHSQNEQNDNYRNEDWEKNQKENWIKAIACYQYDEEIKDEEYGILQEGTKTYEKLLNELTSSQNAPPS